MEYMDEDGREFDDPTVEYTGLLDQVGWEDMAGYELYISEEDQYPVSNLYEINGTQVLCLRCVRLESAQTLDEMVDVCIGFTQMLVHNGAVPLYQYPDDNVWSEWSAHLLSDLLVDDDESTVVMSPGFDDYQDDMDSHCGTEWV